MKVIWTESDIVVGKIVNHRSGLLCIGYCNLDKSKKYGVFHLSTDGLFLAIGDKKQVADHLNQQDCTPIFSNMRHIKSNLHDIVNDSIQNGF